MIIKFKTLQIHNFLSLGDVNINLSDNGFTLVNGINNNQTDLAKSNGSGKSALWDAIVWVLTGETVRGISKNISNIYTDDGCYVKINFIIDDVDYEIIRSKDNSIYGTNLKIYINNEDKSGKGIRDSEKLLSEYLPEVTNELLGSVVILGQGLPQRFTNNTPSGRKEVLEKLSKSDFMIEDIKTRISERKTELLKLQRTYEDKQLVLDRDLINVSSQITSTEYKLNNLVEDTTIDDRINLMQQSINELSLNIQELELNYVSVNSEFEKLHDESDALKDTLNKQITDVNLRYSEKENELYKTSINVQFQITDAKKKLNEILTIKDICPTCGQKLPDIVKPDTSEIERNIKELTIQLDQINSEKTTISMQKQAELQQIEDASKDTKLSILNEIRLIKDKRDSIYSKINLIKNEINNKKLAILRDTASKEQYIKLKKECTLSLESLQQSKIKINDDILYNNKELDIINSRLNVISKLNTIATRDFRGYLLRNIIDFINIKSKEYCQDIFETTNIEFTLDGNNINISYNGKLYENLSGGEKQKIDIIIQFAIRDMLCKFSNFSSNIIVLDEIFDNLDNIGCDKVLNLITTKLTDIESIYIITHHTDIEIPFDNIITIVKENNGISRLK